MPRRTIFSSSPLSVTDGIQSQLQSDERGHLKVSSGSGIVKTLTPVLDTNIYADNDVLFIATEITGVSDVKGGIVKLVNAVCFDGADQGTEVEVFLTTNSTTPGTINEALSAADTVFDDIVGHLHFITYSDLIGSQVCVLKDQDQIIQLAAGATSLYAFGVVRSGTPTYAASSIVLRFGFERL